MLGYIERACGPCRREIHSQLSSICFLLKASRLLFLVFLYDFVAVVLNTTDHFVDEISGLGLEKPPQRNNSLRDSAEMTEEGRIAVCLAEAVDGIGGIV